MGFWDKVVKERKKSARNKDRDDDEALKDLLAEQKAQEEAAAKQAAEAEAQRKAQEEAKRQAEIAARQEAARKEQERLAEANRQASSERTVINSNENIRQQQTSSISPNPENVVNRSLQLNNNLSNNINNRGLEKKNYNEELIEYVDPKTGKVYLLRPGEKPPKGAVLKQELNKTENKEKKTVVFNTATTAISRATENAEKLATGKKALAPSNNKNWAGRANTGQLAMSAANVGLSSVIDVDPNNLTKEQKETFAKE